ncbi:hypothetical protein LXL04_015117 [Taraxacum kok-saghyz]
MEDHTRLKTLGVNQLIGWGLVAALVAAVAEVVGTSFFFLFLTFYFHLMVVVCL